MSDTFGQRLLVFLPSSYRVNELGKQFGAGMDIG
jgi:hypothetical protein